MCSIARLEATMLQLLKRSALSAYAAQQTGAGCSWLPDTSTGAGSGSNGADHGRLTGAGLEEALLQAVK